MRQQAARHRVWEFAGCHGGHPGRKPVPATVLEFCQPAMAHITTSLMPENRVEFGGSRFALTPGRNFNTATLGFGEKP